MLKAILTGPTKTRIISCPAPKKPGHHEVLVRIVRMGICGSDVHYFLHGTTTPGKKPKFPICIGHECAGVVEICGSGIRTFKSGERVFIEPNRACGKCDMCKKNKPHLCRNGIFLGFPGQLEGCLQERMVFPEKALTKLPASISWKDAVLAEPLSIALHAIRLAKIEKGQHIGIVGTGSIGILLIKALRFLFPKNKISSSDIIRNRNKLSSKNGTFQATTPEKYRFPKGQEPEILFECAGVKESLDLCIHSAKPGGKILIIGIQVSPQLQIDAGEMRRKELTLTYVRRQNGQVEDALRFLARGKIKTADIPCPIYPLQKTGQAFERKIDAPDSCIKPMIAVSEECT